MAAFYSNLLTKNVAYAGSRLADSNPCHCVADDVVTYAET